MIPNPAHKVPLTNRPNKIIKTFCLLPTLTDKSCSPPGFGMTELFKPQLTGDGSFTFFSPEFEETFHSHYGAQQEALEKFVLPCQLGEKAVQSSLKLLDICYGLGYNSAIALEKIWQVNPHCLVELIGLESDIRVPCQAIKHQLLSQYQAPVPELLQELATKQKVKTSKLTAKLIIGDARKTIAQVANSDFKAEAIFLDPFSHPKCPQLWTVEFLTVVASVLQPQGILATYSSAASVRKALLLAGLKIGSTPPCDSGRRSPGTVASWGKSEIYPLSTKEKEHLQTRAAVPYRDLQLKDEPETIRERRKQEQQNSSLEPTTQWKKRFRTR